MPSLIRFLTVIAVIAGTGFAAVCALATFVRPSTREIVVTIPAAKLRPPAATAGKESDEAASARASASDPLETR